MIIVVLSQDIFTFTSRDHVIGMDCYLLPFISHPVLFVPRPSATYAGRQASTLRCTILRYVQSAAWDPLIAITTLIPLFTPSLAYTHTVCLFFTRLFKSKVCYVDCVCLAYTHLNTPYSHTREFCVFLVLFHSFFIPFLRTSLLAVIHLLLTTSTHSKQHLLFSFVWNTHIHL